MKKSTLSFPLAILMVFVIACTCGKLDNQNNSNSNNSNSSESGNSNGSENNNKSNENKTTSTKTDSTGIPECDAYVQMIEDYLNCNNVPEASREQWKKQRDDTIQKIKNAAKTESGKQFMASFCKQVTETAKDQLKCN